MAKYLNVNFIPSPNWFLNDVVDTSLEGLLAYGYRNYIVVFDINKEIKFCDNFSGHSVKVVSVQFSKNKTNPLLASLDENGELKLWDLENALELVASYRFTDSSALSACWKYGCKGTIYVGHGARLKEFEIGTNVKKKKSAKLTTGVSIIRSCPCDSNTLIVGLKNDQMCVFDTHTFSVKFQIDNNKGTIFSLSFITGSSKQFVSASTEGIKFWTLPKSEDESVKYISICDFKRSKFETGDTIKKPLFQVMSHPSDPNKIIGSNPNGNLMMWELTDTNKPVMTLLKTTKGGHYRGILNLFLNAQDPNIVISHGIDRKMIFWNLEKMQSVHEVSVLSNSVQSLVFEPTNNIRMAIAVSDGCIRLWNTSPNATTAIEGYQKNIRGRVCAISWHPKLEGTLAFSCDNGHVGFFDTDIRRTNFFAKRHMGTVYNLCWGPCEILTRENSESSGNDFYLYSCGSGIVLVHNMAKMTKHATNLDKLLQNYTCEKRERCEIRWKPDFTVFVVGNTSGLIEIFDGENFTLLAHCKSISKNIQCLRWHPEYISLSSFKCQMHNWLACGSKGNNVYVFDLEGILGQSDGEIKEFEPLRMLQGHMNNIPHVAWSPHVEVHLLSTSCDNTVQVWDVMKGQPVVSFRGHTNRVYTAEWCPSDPDIIYSGGEDAIIFEWRMSQQNDILPPEFRERKVHRKRRPTKLKELTNPENESEDVLDTSMSTDSKIEKDLSKTSILENEGEKSSSTVDNKEEKCNVDEQKTRPKNSKLYPQEKYFKELVSTMRKSSLMEAVQMCKEYSKSSSGHSGSISEKYWRPEHSESQSVSCLMGLFGDKQSFFEAVDFEASASKLEETFDYEFWKGNVKSSIETMANKDSLTPLQVSLAPLVSREFWFEMMERYANQMAEQHQYLLAIPYYIACGKTVLAVEMLMKSGNVVGALVLARMRLPETDPIITNLFTKWATNLKIQHLNEYSACCHIAMKNPLKAASVAAESLKPWNVNLAAKICLDFDFPEDTHRYTLQCVQISLCSNEWDVALDCLASQPKLKDVQCVVNAHKAIVDLLQEPSKEYGLCAQLFPKELHDNELLVWKSYTVGDVSFLQYLYDTCFCGFLDPTIETFRNAVTFTEKLLQQKKHGIISQQEMTFYSSLEVCMYLFCVLSDDYENNCLKHLCSVFSNSLSSNSMIYANMMFRLFFPFDVIWDCKLMNLKIQTTAKNTEGILDEHMSNHAHHFSELKILKEQKYIGNVNFLQSGKELTNVAQEFYKLVTNQNSHLNFLSFFAMNLFRQMKEQCDIEKILFSCTEVLTNGDHINGSSGNELSPEAATESLVTGTVEAHSYCIQVSRLFLQLTQVFGALLSQDVFAINQYLCGRREKTGDFLRELRFKEKREIVLKDAKTIEANEEKEKAIPDDIGHIPNDEVLEAEKENCSFQKIEGEDKKLDDIKEVKSNEEFSEKEEKSQKVEECNEPITCDEKIEVSSASSLPASEQVSVEIEALENMYKGLSDLLHIFTESMKDTVAPDSLPEVSALMSLCADVDLKVNCSEVKVELKALMTQMKLWTQKFKLD